MTFRPAPTNEHQYDVINDALLAIEFDHALHALRAHRDVLTHDRVRKVLRHIRRKEIGKQNERGHFRLFEAPVLEHQRFTALRARGSTDRRQNYKSY